VLFGAFLKYSGFSQFINDIALTLVGQTPGGPAKVAVIASALMGMINGSAIANVATTGTITIPLMKKTGYKKDFAAAVEAVASTGGQFTPPIMGAVGFVMAEFMCVSYTKVMLAAAIPAVCANVIFLLKETSVFSAISLMDLMFTAKDLIGLYYKTTESLFLLVVFYLILLLPISILGSLLERRLRYAGFGA